MAFNPGTLVTLSATPALGDAFSGWTGACFGQGVCVITMDAAKNVTALFQSTSPTPTPTPIGLSVAIAGSGAITSIPQGINCTSNSGVCNSSFDAGTLVTLSPAPSTGYKFDGWFGGCTGSGPCVVTADVAKSVTATFVPLSPIFNKLDVAKPIGGIVTSSPLGINCGSVCTYSFSNETTVGLTASADIGYVFSGWAGDCSGASECKLAMSSNHNVSANFTVTPTARKLLVSKFGNGTIASTPTGINCGTSCQASFTENTSVALVSKPDIGWKFSGWAGSCTGGDKCNVLMDGDKTVSGQFTESPKYPLKVIKPNGGVISSAVPGIDCGNDHRVCSASFSEVTLTAAPDYGYVLDKWVGCPQAEGNSCKLNLSSAVAIRASFKALPKYAVTITKNRYGSVTSTPPILSCLSAIKSCSAKVIKGSIVILTANPDTNRSFVGWSGACSGKDPCRLIMDGNKGLGAVFQ